MVFKNSNGVYLGRELFFETSQSEGRPYALYSLKSEDFTFDGKVYPSLRRLYLGEDDPTEFFIAEKYFDGQPHWKRLTAQEWFLSILSPLREELETKHRAQYLKALRADAIAGDKVTARYLLDRVEKIDSKVGRPTKQKIQQEAQKIARESSDIKDDFSRLSDLLSSEPKVKP